MKKIFLVLLLHTGLASGQSIDSTWTEKTSIHAQTTVINQYKPAFHVKYSGPNSLVPAKEDQTSLTSTLFAGARLWKGANAFINPEIAGGSGLSQAFGVAASTNGETFRVGTPEPKIYLARLFIQQVFSFSKNVTYQPGDFNQLAGKQATKYLAITLGKVSVADYFDDNEYSHDPRTQFMSWGLMDNGAWDYPANTRGYTPSLIAEFVTPMNELKYAASLIPLVANGSTMDWQINKASSHSLEWTHRYLWKERKGNVRFLSFFTTGNMGNYTQSNLLNPLSPDITSTRNYGHTKYGFGISADQQISHYAGIFFRASWNDGNNETWVFSEIDRTASAGISSNGSGWKRPNDNVGLAYVVCGISKPHRDYLKSGGKGFMLGDGNLNYALEQLSEFYYSAAIVKERIFLSGAYQFLLNPGYNRDRMGPVNVLSVRVHCEI